MRILKFDLEVTDIQKIVLPKNGALLCVQVQDGKPKLWVEEISSLTEEREIITLGTGQEADDILGGGATYIGTYQLPTGFVGHVYRRYKL